jgi:hypothetical protein
MLDHEWRSPTEGCTRSSRARTTHPAFDVKRGAKPTGVGRDLPLPASCLDEVSNSCRFCSGLIQHRDVSVAEDDAVTRGPHHKVVIADDEASAIGTQTQRGVQPGQVGVVPRSPRRCGDARQRRDRRRGRGTGVVLVWAGGRLDDRHHEGKTKACRHGDAHSGAAPAEPRFSGVERVSHELRPAIDGAYLTSFPGSRWPSPAKPGVWGPGRRLGAIGPGTWEYVLPRYSPPGRSTTSPAQCRTIQR